MRSVLPALLVLALAAGPAPAAMVSLTTSQHYDPGNDIPRVPDDWTAYIATLDVAAPEHETNRMTFQIEGEHAVLRDDASPLSPGAGCEALDANAVRCAHGYPAKPPHRSSLVVVWRVGLGDGDDAFTAAPGPIYDGAVDGGAGADTIMPGGARAIGGDGDDTLSGARTLDGGPGADSLTGGAGGQTLIGGPGPDRMDGGEGQDTLSYADHTEPVQVDLAAATAGGAAAGDSFAGIEWVEGGAGDDVLRAAASGSMLLGGSGADRLEGAAGPDALRAGPGDDTLIGADGDDTLDDGAGDDTADGGAGADQFWGGQETEAPGFGADRLLGGPGRDTFEYVSEHDHVEGGDAADQIRLVPRLATLDVTCGAGRDRIGPMNRRLLMPADCERVELGDRTDHPESTVQPADLRIGRTHVTLKLPGFCDYENRCPTMLSIFAHGRLVARGRRVLDDGPALPVRARIVGRHARRLRRAQVIEVRITASTRSTRHLDDGFRMNRRRTSRSR